MLRHKSPNDWMLVATPTFVPSSVPEELKRRRDLYFDGLARSIGISAPLQPGDPSRVPSFGGGSRLASMPEIAEPLNVTPGSTCGVVGPNPTPPTDSPVTITIGGVAAQVIFDWITASGLYQFNVIVPNTPSGDQALQATVNGVETAPGPVVTIQ